MEFLTLAAAKTWLNNSGVLDWEWFDGFDENEMIEFAYRHGHEYSTENQLVAAFLRRHGQTVTDYDLGDSAFQGYCECGEPVAIDNADLCRVCAIDIEQLAVSTAAAALGRKGGSAKTAAKAAAVRENGKRGGRPTKYVVSYSVSIDAAEETVNSINYLNDGGKLSTLPEVVENCKSLATDAVLYDRAGFKKGWVCKDGNWQLN